MLFVFNYNTIGNVQILTVLPSQIVPWNHYVVSLFILLSAFNLKFSLPVINMATFTFDFVSFYFLHLLISLSFYFQPLSLFLKMYFLYISYDCIFKPKLTLSLNGITFRWTTDTLYLILLHGLILHGFTWISLHSVCYWFSFSPTVTQLSCPALHFICVFCFPRGFLIKHIL